MLPLKEAIAEKHSLAEKMTFNQRMFNGELSNEEYILYLCQQLAIFDAIEIHELPHPALDRAKLVYSDIKELMELKDGEALDIKPLEATNEYRKYLNTLTKEEQLLLRSKNPGKSDSWYKTYERQFRKERTIKLIEINYDKTINDNDVADACGIGHWAINNWDKAVGYNE